MILGEYLDAMADMDLVSDGDRPVSIYQATAVHERVAAEP